MKVRHTPRSRADVSAIFRYLATRNPNGATNVALAIARTLRLIGQHPYVGHDSGEQNSRVLPVSRYPYLVYWVVEEGEVLILHVRHAARKPWMP